MARAGKRKRQRGEVGGWVSWRTVWASKGFLDSSVPRLGIVLDLEDAIIPLGMASLRALKMSGGNVLQGLLCYIANTVLVYY